MKTTAKYNGLKMNDWIDERRDPYKSTVAAAKVLKSLYDKFGTWEMALAAYNYGENGVRKRIKRWKTNDYWELYLPRETENFVPKIMATIFVMREPELFGFKKNGFSEELPWKEFDVSDCVDLRNIAKWCDVDTKDIQMLNPELKQMCTPPGQEYTLRIPVESYDKFVNKFSGLSDEDRFLSKQEIDRRVRRVIYYKVRRGDSIWKIARKFKVSMRKLKKWNKLTKNTIYPNQKLKIYKHGI
jgi:membrane-bound lytic murein transglycosylase D